MNKQIFKDAKIGDKVWSIEHGAGIVYSIEPNDELPLFIMFAEYSKHYDFQGHTHKLSKKPSIFYQSFEIPEHAFKKPKKDWSFLFPDAPVFVNNGGDIWTHSFYAEKSLDNKRFLVRPDRTHSFTIPLDWPCQSYTFLRLPTFEESPIQTFLAYDGEANNWKCPKGFENSILLLLKTFHDVEVIRGSEVFSITWKQVKKFMILEK